MHSDNIQQRQMRNLRFYIDGSNHRVSIELERGGGSRPGVGNSSPGGPVCIQVFISTHYSG